MKKREFLRGGELPTYTAPQLEMLEFVVERGFAESDEGDLWGGDNGSLGDDDWSKVEL